MVVFNCLPPTRRWRGLVAHEPLEALASGRVKDGGAVVKALRIGRNRSGRKALMATPIPQNQCPLTLGEITRATGGTLFGGTDTLAVRGVGIDSRNLRPGAVFVAIRGATHDGHAYLAQVAKGGAAAAVVERGRRAAMIPSVEVGDTLVALGDIARFHLERERAARAIPLLAVGGSAGKTTTKEIAAALVRALFGSSLSTPGNLNNLVGVPMTVLTLTPDHRACVIECGTNVRGEMARLGAILSPDVTLIVNVDVEHSEGLGSLESIADEETSILRFTRRAAVVPFEDALVTARITAGLRRIGFGDSRRADVRLISRLGTRDGYSKITIGLAPALVAPNAPVSLAAELRMLGPQAAINATAALAAAAALWQKPLTREQLESIERALNAIAPVEGRLSSRTIAGAIVIDDSYNSNPRSVRAALSAADEAARIRKARLVIAMGDMLELGALSQTAHAEMVREVARLSPAVFVAVGPEIGAACRADAEASNALLAADSDDAARILRAILRTGDVLLVKGSRGLRMERIIEALERD